MHKIDKFFDINMVLMTLFASLETVRDKKNIELVYDIDPTIPKELKGNVNAVTHILTHMLTFVLQNSEKNEVLFSLYAPKDFLYEESVSFVVKDSGMFRQEIMDFLESKIKADLDEVNGTILYSKDSSDIHISIPFKLNELGNRRYYRLPDMGMLGKKVLLISKSKNIATSLPKMFKYFLYEVDVGKEAYKKRGSNLAYYDLFVLDEGLINEGLEDLVRKVQETTELKYVILRDSGKSPIISSKIESVYLVKPVMQESIYELIISLFKETIQNRTIKSINTIQMINMDKYIDEAFVQSEKIFVNGVVREIEQSNITPVKISEEKDHKVLNINAGKQNTQKMGLKFRDELTHFIEVFDRSDIYFRNISQAKAVWQIKEFCIRLEKQANIIGAEKVADIAEQVSLLFVYDKLDDLPVYAAKYHLELVNVMAEIKAYLKQ
jgi:hypothetical protein